MRSTPDDDLYLLAFDHRTSLLRGLLGTADDPSPDVAQQIADGKMAVFEGLAAAAGRLPGPGTAGFLVDDRFGAAVPAAVRAAGLTLVVAVERSGQRELVFEHGDAFGDALHRAGPDYAKVLVRYNPAGDREMNTRQRARLAVLQEWLAPERPRLMVELLVPAEPEQLAAVGGERARYDAEVRPGLATAAIEELTQAGLRPAVWKIEGLDRQEDCVAVADVCRAADPSARCVILGRGADRAAVVGWLRAAAPVPAFSGFAIGRSIWWDVLVDHFHGRRDRDVLVSTVRDRFLDFAAAWHDVRRHA